MKQQNKLFKIFEVAKHKNQFANAYLLVGENANQYPLKIVEYITDEKERVQSHNYQDYLSLESDLKKEDVIYLQTYFNKKPVEKLNKKIYSILNVENASIAALNSLLKFLEEPVSDTIAILTCSQKERVLPTIISRCNVIQLEYEEKIYTEKAYELFNKYQNEANIDILFIKLHQETKDAKYQDFYDFYSLMIQRYKERRQDIYFSIFTICQNEFEKSCNISLVLDKTLYLIKEGSRNER